MKNPVLQLRSGALRRLTLSVSACFLAACGANLADGDADTQLGMSADQAPSRPQQAVSTLASTPETGLQWSNGRWDINGAPIPDFSYAGYGFGVEAIPDFSNATLINATEHGVVANDEVDDSEGLQTALEAARGIEGRVLLVLPKGRILLSEILSIDRSELVIRGQGSGLDGTEIHIPRPLNLIDTGGKFDEISEYLVKFDKIQREKSRNVLWPFSPYSWSGGFLWVGPDGHRAAPYLEERDRPDTVLAEITSGTRGGFDLSISNPEDLTAGDDIEIVWYSRDGDTSGIINQIYGDTDLKVGSHHWSFPNRGLVRQKTVIRGVSEDGITIMDPLLHDVGADVPASVVDWSPLVNVGIEDLAITFPEGVSFGHHLEQGFNGIYFTGTRNGWVRDVRIKDADSGILTYSSANLSIDNILTEGERTAHYAVHAGNVHNVLVSDLIVHNPVRHSLSVNTQSTKTVYQRSSVYRDAVLDQHAGANHQNLFDQTLLHVDAKSGDEGKTYPIWDGSGAGYWQPGHGRFNTTYNLEVRVRSGATRDETLTLTGLAEGPDARIIGVWGNRTFDVDYRPEPLVSQLNEQPDPISLYDAQLARRLK